MGWTTPQLQRMITAAETEARLYGMTLNSLKQNELRQNPSFPPSLTGDVVSSQVKSKHLGSMLPWQKPLDTAFI